MKNILLFRKPIWLLLICLSLNTAWAQGPIMTWDFTANNNAVTNLPGGTTTISSNGISFASTGCTGNGYGGSAWAAGDYIQILAPTTGYEITTMTLNVRSSNTGPAAFNVQYSSTGTSGTFTTLSTLSSTNASSCASRTIDFSSINALDNNPNVVIRLVCRSDGEADGNPSSGNPASGGTFRMDDVVINGVAIPTCTSQTITALATPVTKTFGDATYSVFTNATPSGLTVTYGTSNGSVASVDANGIVTIQGAGTATITASQAGDGTYCAANPVTQALTVNKATPTITTNPTASNITFGQTLVASSLTGGSVSVLGTFAFTTSSTAPNAGTASYSVTFTPTDTANYNTITTSVNVTTDKATPTITASGFQSLEYNGSPQGPDSSTTSSTGTRSYSYSGTTYGSVAYGPTAVKPTNAGDYNVVATVAEDDNYLSASSAAYSFTIAKAGLTVTADDKTAVQNSSIPSFTVSYTGFVNGEDETDLITAPTADSPTANIAVVNNYSIVATGGVSDNYNFTYVDGSFSVTSASQPVCPSGTTIAPGNDQIVCEGSVATLLTATAATSGINGTPTIQYQWYYNLTDDNTVLGATQIDGATSSTYSPSTATVETRYYFCVAYAVDNECVQNSGLQALASNTVKVEVIDTPEATINPSGSITLCEGNSAVLTANASESYLWSNGATTQAINVGVSGDYSVVVTAANGCQSPVSEVTSVTVNPLPATPTITPSGSTTLCAGESVTLTSSVGDAYLWSNDEETSSIEVSTSGNYSVQVIDSNGCLSNSSEEIIVTVSSALVVGSVSNLDVPAPGANHVVISQIYGGGGNSGATYRNDFVELYNSSDNSVSLTGWSIQQASATGTTWTEVNLSGTIPAKGYYLIQGASGGAVGALLPTPDATSLFNIGVGSGKIALSNATTSYDGTSCPSAALIDFIGFGSSANCSETSPGPLHTNTTATVRINGGCTDTNNNATDFTATTPSPRNTSSSTYTCTVSSSVETICSGTAPSTITVSSASGSTGSYTYQWYRFDGITTAPTGSVIPETWTLVGSGASFSPVALTQDATFACFVTPQDCAGAWSNGQRQVTVNALPTASIVETDASGVANNDSTVCSGDSATLTASGGTSYSWNTNPIQTTAAIVVSPTAETAYTVTVTNANGCSASAQATIMITPLTTPTVSLVSSDADNTFAYGTSVTFTANAGNLGGGTASYDFKVNGVSVQDGASNTYTVSTANENNLANGDQVSVSITVTGGTCLSTLTVDSNVIANTVTGAYFTNITNYCGQTLLAVGSRIKCSVPSGVVGVLGYRFKVTNNVTAMSTTVDSNVASFNMGMINSSVFAYGTSYNVQVAAIVNGVLQPYSSGVCVITTPSVPSNQVTSLCGQTLESLNTRIYASTVSGSVLYRWRVALSTAPTTYFTLTTTSSSFRLTNVPNLNVTFGKTYLVEVQSDVVINGVSFTSDYSTVCNVSTPAASTISVSANQCGQTLTTILDRIYVNSVPNAVNYTYRVQKVGSAQAYDFKTSFTSFRLNNFPSLSLTYDSEYNVSVMVEILIDGVYYESEFSTPCIISTPPFPTVGLQSSQCSDGNEQTPGPYQVQSNSELIYSEFVSGASYEFLLQQLVNGVPTGTPLSTTRSGNYFTLDMIDGELADTDYVVYVKLLHYGEGPVGKDCIIRTPSVATKMVVTSAFAAKAYPNPFANNFLIDLTTESQSSVSIKVYDMVGRVVDQRSVAVSDMKSMTIGEQYPSGVYNVIITQGEEVKTLRVIKR